MTGYPLPLCCCPSIALSIDHSGPLVVRLPAVERETRGWHCDCDCDCDNEPSRPAVHVHGERRVEWTCGRKCGRGLLWAAVVEGGAEVMRKLLLMHPMRALKVMMEH